MCLGQIYASAAHSSPVMNTSSAVIFLSHSDSCSHPQAISNVGVQETDGVFQLTTLGGLPLKSPKRLIALQLANSNPAFR